ncbi:MAG TPA: RNA polymerase sigma factor [Vicinamibacterales bacterium]|nr:RNA polymerase sigma factor [Vicinamibacterales bacterium]
MPATLEGPVDDPASRLGILFDTHHQRLFRLASRLARSVDDAHDLVQETFLRAARSPGSIPFGAASEEAWLVRVLVNICRDGWRASAVRRRAVDDGTVIPDAPGHPESALIARKVVHQALQKLPPRRRAILVLYELDGTPVKEIAAMLRMNAVTVRWHLSVGRREMARLLGDGRAS